MRQCQSIGMVMTPTDDLRLAIKLSGKHSEQALTVARKNVHRRYRCPALYGIYFPARSPFQEWAQWCHWL
jgi:hypothetical protein